MTPQEFRSTLRPWLDREPFQPLAFVLTTGERREVHLRSAIRYPDGSAAYISTADDPFGNEVPCEDVERIEPLGQREITIVTAEAFFDELRRLCDGQPFRPFRIELKSGSRLDIDDPEGLAFAGGHATFIPAEGYPTDFAHTDVARIITAEPAASS
jgi:hypothetical protein